MAAEQEKLRQATEAVATEFTRPLPKIRPWTEGYWKAAKEHRLVMQWCEPCDKLIYYPRKWCPKCGNEEISWKGVGGKGKLVTFTRVFYGAPPEFWFSQPYTIGLVRLDEGPMMGSMIVNVPDGSEPAIGMRVRAFYEDVDETITLVQFEPDGA